VADISIELFYAIPSNVNATLVLEHDGIRVVMSRNKPCITSHRTAHIYSASSGADQDAMEQTCSLQSAVSTTFFAPALQGFVGSRVTGGWTLSLLLNHTEEHAVLLGATLRFALEPNFDILLDNATGSLQMVGLDESQAAQAILNELRYSNNASYPNLKVTRNFSISLVDEQGLAVHATALVTLHHLRNTNLTSINEDDFTSQDKLNTVHDIVSSANVPDLDHLPQRDGFGIAVIEAQDENGEFQFWTGSQWQPFGNRSETSGLLLDSVTLVRFVPDPDFHERASFAFKLWDTSTEHADSDLSSGLQGLDTTLNTQVFHNAISRATIVVEPVNDSPVLASGGAMTTYDEDVPLTENLGDIIKDMVAGFYADIDRATPSGTNAKLGVAVVGAGSEYGIWEQSCDFVSFTPLFGNRLADGRLFPRDPTPEYATLLDGNCVIRFDPAANFNTDVDINGLPWQSDVRPCLQIRGWDNTGRTRGLNQRFGINTIVTNTTTDEFSSFTDTICITFASINDQPALRVRNGSSGQFVYLEDHEPTRVCDRNAIQLIDPDDADMVHLEVTFDAIDENETLSIQNASGVTVGLMESGTEQRYRFSAPGGISKVTIQNLTWCREAIALLSS
jgi:hypothetical protein